MDVHEVYRESGLAGLLARYQVLTDRRLWGDLVRTAEQRGDVEGREVAERALAGLPDVGVFDSIRAGVELVQLLTGWRWIAIQQAREEGHSWSEIGDALGKSKQAAWELYRTAIEHQEKYVPQYHNAARARAVLDDPGKTLEIN